MLNQLGRIDIYLLDQIMKGRISSNMRILDAGCGNGRNSEYFIRNNYDSWGFDLNETAIEQLKELGSQWNSAYDFNKFVIGNIENPPFEDSFDFIISSAVLHFSENRQHFIQLFESLVNLLNPNGILWIRMTTKHTIKHLAQHLYDDCYLLPDGSTRYLLDQTVLAGLMEKHQLQFLDPFKTINVADIRTMATVVLQKH